MSLVTRICAALEGLVAQHLRAWIAYSGRDLALRYWRTRHQVVEAWILAALVLVALWLLILS